MELLFKIDKYNFKLNNDTGKIIVLEEEKRNNEFIKSLYNFVNTNLYKDDVRHYFVSKLVMMIVIQSKETDIFKLKENIINFCNKPRIGLSFNKKTTCDERIDMLVKIYNERYNKNFVEYISDPSQTKTK